MDNNLSYGNSDLTLNSNNVNLIDEDLSESNPDLINADLSESDNDLDSSNNDISIDSDSNREISNPESANYEQSDSSNALADSNAIDIYVSPEGDDDSGVGSQSNPYKTVYKALENINANANIHFASGRYLINRNMPFGFEGKSINLIGDEGNEILFDAEGSQESYCFGIEANNNVTFNNIKFVRFYLKDNCMFRNEGTLLFKDCRFENNNYDSERYGLISVIVNSGNLTIENSRFIGNDALSSGTLIYNTNASLNIIGSEFRNFRLGTKFRTNSFIDMIGGDLLNVSSSSFENIYGHGLNSDRFRLINGTNATVYFTDSRLYNMNISNIIYSSNGNVHFIGNDVFHLFGNHSYFTGGGQLLHVNKDLNFSNNNLTDIEGFSSILFTNQGLIVLNNNFTNISQGQNIISLNVMSGFDYNISNNKVIKTFNHSNIVYIKGNGGKISITDNVFEDIEGYYHMFYYSNPHGVLSFYYAQNFSAYLQNNSMGSLRNISAIYIEEGYSNMINYFTINLNVSIDTYMDQNRKYEVKVTDDMGNGVNVYGGYSPFIETTPNAFIRFYLNGTEVCYSNITEGFAYFRFHEPFENGEYRFTANASFLSNESVITDTVILNIPDVSTHIYVSDVNGSDETGNGTEENPYKSLKRAFADIVELGKVTIHLGSGTYSGENNENVSVFLDSGVGLRVNIIGEDLENTFISPQTYAFCMMEDSSLYINNVTLSSAISYTAKKSGNSINYAAGNVALENCRLEGICIKLEQTPESTGANIYSYLNRISIINSSGSIFYFRANDFSLVNSNVSFMVESSLDLEMNKFAIIYASNSMNIENSSLSHIRSGNTNGFYGKDLTMCNSNFTDIVSLTASTIGSANLNVENCIISNIQATTSSIFGASESLIYRNNTMSGYSNFNVQFHGGLINNYSNTPKEVIVSDSIFEDIDCWAPIIYLKNPLTGAVVDNCTFINCTAICVETYGGANATISNCKFLNSSLSGIRINDPYIWGYVEIVNNTFNNSYGKYVSTVGELTGGYCIILWGGLAFLENNTISSDENVSIIGIREANIENPDSIYMRSYFNAHVKFLNDTVNSSNPNIYISVCDDMGNPVTYYNSTAFPSHIRNMSFILSEELMGYAAVFDGISCLPLQKILPNGVYEFTGVAPFASNQSVIEFANLTIDFDYGLTKVYVAANGSDDEGDGTEENPFKSISKGIEYGFSKTLNVEIYIKEGVYSGDKNTNLTIDNLGYLSLIGADGFNKTLIDAEDMNIFIDTSQRSNINLYNLSFANAHVDNNSSAISSLGIISIENCVFENLTVENGYMIASCGEMNLRNSIFINRENSDSSAICIDGGESYLKNNTMSNFEGINGSIHVKSGLINAVVTYMDNTTFIAGGYKLYLKATVTDDMGNRICGGNVSFIINTTCIEEGTYLNRGVVNYFAENHLEDGQYLLWGSYSAASQSSILNMASFTALKNHELADVYVAVNGSDEEGDGTENKPLKTIAGAINYGSFKGFNIRVLIKEGVYSGVGNVDLDIDFPGNLTFAGADGYNKSIIDANDSRFFTINQSYSLNLINLTFINSLYDIYAENYAPIYNLGNLTVTDCIFENHTRSWYGLIYNKGNLCISGTVFNHLSPSERYSLAQHGGAIYSTENTRLEVYGSKFYNSDKVYSGGAIYAKNPNETYIENCEFINCSASWYGGAIYVSGESKDTCIIDNYFENCSAERGGEAIYVQSYVDLENNEMIGCNESTAPIYAGYANAYLYYDDLYTNIRTGFTITVRLCDDKGNIISTSNNNKISLVIGDKTIFSSDSISTGYRNIGINTIFENGEYLIGGNITGIDGDLYIVSVTNGTLIVNKTADSPITVYVDKDNGDDSGIGSLQNPFKTLSRAVEFACSESIYPTIVLTNSLYSGEGYVNQSFENLKALTLIGWSSTFDGEGSNWIFSFNNISNLSISNIRFINAKSDGLGSAIFANNTESISIRGDFSNNVAKEGGAIYIEGDASINNSLFEDNSADYGGAIVCNGNLIVNNTILNNCSASDSSIIVYSGTFAGESNFWGANYFTPEEFINANILVRGTGESKVAKSPENWVILNSNVKNATYENLTKVYDIFFSHYNDTEVVDTLTEYWVVINSSLGNSMDERIMLPEGRGIDNILYSTGNPGVDRLTFSSLKGLVLLEYDIVIKKFNALDVVYVSSDGDDDTGDGSYEAPFKTLSNGMKFVKNNGNLFLNGYFCGSFGPDGYLSINKNLTISSYDGDAILDGLGTYQIFNVNENIALTLDGLAFINGAGGYGAFMAEKNSVVNIRNSKFINNKGSNDYSVSINFGAVNNCSFVLQGGSIDNCSFENNSGTIVLIENIPISNSTFMNNNLTKEFIYVFNGFIMENCEFINNSYQYGIFSDNGVRPVSISVSDSLFENNHATSGFGGIFYGFMNLDLEGTSFIDNSADNHPYATGGAIYMDSGNLYAFNCTFINNSALYSGGAIYTATAKGIYIYQCVFANNSANYGGVVRGTDITVEKSIFEGNIGSNVSAIMYMYSYEDTGNYWGKNYESAEEFIGDSLIAHQIVGNEYNCEAPEKWILLTLSCEDEIEWNSFNEIEVSLDLFSDGETIEYEYLPDYTVFIKDSLGNVIPCEVLIKDGVGTFTYNASYRVDDTISIYGTLSENMIFSKDIRVVIPTSTSLTVPETVAPGEEIPVSVDVEAKDMSTPEGNVSLYVDGVKVKELAVENGIAKGNFTINKSGYYEITAIFNGYYYGTSNDTANLRVTKLITNLILSNCYANEGDNAVMDISLTDINGNPLNGNISISLVDGSIVNLTVDGKASYDFGIFNEVGNYTIFAEYAGDDDREYSNASATIVIYGPGNVTVKHTDAGDAADIQAAIDSANPGDIIRLGDYDYVNVSDVIISKNLTISGDGASITSTGDGTPIFNVPAISEGGPESVAITGVDFKLSNGDIVVKATADNDTEDPLSIVTPNISINGNAFELANETTVAESITVLELDSERGILSPTGEISISGNSIVAGINPFDFEVTSIGTGDNINISPQNLTVEKKATVIHYADMNTTTVDQSVDGRAGEYFNFQLTDTEGNPIVGVPMQIGFLGVIYDESKGIITNETGGARLQINLGYKNDYTFAICFLGNDEYNGSFVIAKIIVTPQKGSLTVPNKSYSASAKTKTLTATFKSASGKPVSGKKITFTVNGKTYYAKTNDKGVASVNVSLSKKGTYSFTAKFATNGMYETMTKTAKLTIK